MPVPVAVADVLELVDVLVPALLPDEVVEVEELEEELLALELEVDVDELVAVLLEEVDAFEVLELDEVVVPADALVPVPG